MAVASFCGWFNFLVRIPRGAAHRSTDGNWSAFPYKASSAPYTSVVERLFHPWDPLNVSFSAITVNTLSKLHTRVAELGSLSSVAKMAMKIFVKRVFTIFASNASFLRVREGVQKKLIFLGKSPKLWKKLLKMCDYVQKRRI